MKYEYSNVSYFVGLCSSMECMPGLRSAAMDDDWSVDGVISVEEPPPPPPPVVVVHVLAPEEEPCLKAPIHLLQVLALRGLVLRWGNMCYYYRSPNYQIVQIQVRVAFLRG